MVTFRIAYALGVVPAVVATYWYSRRLGEVRDARDSDNRSAEALRRLSQLEKRVTREGYLTFLGILSYWLLLSVLL